MLEQGHTEQHGSAPVRGLTLSGHRPGQHRLLVWAVGYNALALPLAAGVLAGVGLVLPAWMGAVLMSLSTIIVAINAQTLRRLNLERAP